MGTSRYKPVLKRAEREYCRLVGLSSEEMTLYDLLLSKGRLTAQEAASYTLNFPSAHYRLFYKLEKLGLVRRISSRPRAFAANPLQNGLNASYSVFTGNLTRLLSKNLKAKAKNTDVMELIAGRQALYDRYEEFAKEAKSEIMLYSIGIAYSRGLEKTQKQAIKRGVLIRHIVQQLKPSNYYVINKWLRLGVKLRYLKQERGFHITIFDRRVVVLTFSDSEDTENRLTIVTSNKTAADLFVSYFMSLWVEAKDW